MFRALFFAAAILVSGCSFVEKPVTPPVDFSQIRGAVREIGPMQDGKFVGICSGVMIDETTLLTAAHCDTSVAGRELTLRGYRAFVIKKDEKRDLMLLHVPSGGGCPCVGSAFTPREDAIVYVVGFPVDKGKVLTEGRYQGPTTDGSEDHAIGMVLITAPVTWGNSGGGVFAKTPTGKWALVGIISRGTVFGWPPTLIAHLNLAAGYESIVEFIAVGKP